MTPADVRPGYVLPHRTTVLAICGALLAVVLAASGQTIILTAMPAISAAVGKSHDYSWLFTSYMLSMAMTVSVYGRLSDIYGRRPFLTGAIVLYLVGSVVGATADSMLQLVIARVLQGIAAGALIPLPQAVIGDLVPPSERGRWQGFFGLAVAIASLLGPVGGGWLADHAPWQWIFLAPMPLGVFALIVIVATVRIPQRADRRLGVDVPGSLLLTAGVGSALLATATGGNVFAWSSPVIVVLYAVGVVALAGFVVVERRSPHPLVPPAVLRSPTVAWASVAGIGIGAAHFGAMAYVPLFVQGALGTSATSAGLVLMPLLLAMVTTTSVSGQVIARTGRYRWALISGPIVGACGYAWLATLDQTSTRAEVTLGAILIGAGVGLIWQNLLLVVQNAAPSRDIGVATSTAQLCRSLGNTIGVTVLGAIVTAGLTTGDLNLGSRLDPAVREQTAHAVHPVFLAGIPLCALVLCAACLVPEIPLRRSVHEEEPAAARADLATSPLLVDPAVPPALRAATTTPEGGPR